MLQIRPALDSSKYLHSGFRLDIVSLKGLHDARFSISIQGQVSKTPISHHTRSGPSFSDPLLPRLPIPDNSGSYSGVPGTSPASCSSVFLAVSGTSSDVKTPSSMKAANIS